MPAEPPKFRSRPKPRPDQPRDAPAGDDPSRGSRQRDERTEHGRPRDGDRARPRFGKSRPGKPRPGESAAGMRSTRDQRDDDRIELFGVHAVAAALANPERRFLKIQATDNAARRLEAEITARGLTVEPVRPRELDNLLGADTVHQGILAIVEPLPEPLLEDLIRAAGSTGGPLIVLDQVTDPHNVGAVLRSAAVFGASGLVTTRRHSPPLNGTLAKSASGALELVPVALEQNLARTLEEMKEAGVTVIGLDGEGETLLDDEPLDGAIAFVLGAEGKGLRQLTRETCHRVCRIATGGALASLNVSNAAAIALHLAAMRRRPRA